MDDASGVLCAQIFESEEQLVQSMASFDGHTEDRTMIRTHEVPKPRWPSFLDSLNEWALGRPVRVEIAFLELGDQELGEHLQYKSIFLDKPNQELVVILGTDEEEVSHRAPVPSRLVVGEETPFEFEWLAFEVDDNRKTFIYFERLPQLESGPS